MTHYDPDGHLKKKNKREPKVEKPWPTSGVITKLSPTHRDPTRYAIHVDKKYVTALDQSQVNELHLQVGNDWTQQLHDEVKSAREYDQARRYAMGILARRAYSSGQIQEKLVWKKGYSKITAAKVIERLTELRLIDDQAFAEALVRETQNAKPAGARLLRQKLIQKKVDPKLAERVANAAEQETDPTEDAYQLASKKWFAPSTQRLQPQARERRVYGLLARRGFSSNVISSVMARLKSEQSE